METTVKLKYENGVFRPLDAVNVAEGAVVDATISQRPPEITDQHERIEAWIDKWYGPLTGITEEWWEEFDAFLRANRFDLPVRDLGLDDL